MLPKKLLAGGVFASVLIAGVAWAVIGPDSMWQNHVIDPSRARQVTDCHLTYWDDQRPADDQVVVILGHGWYLGGEPSVEEARKVFAIAVANFQGLARANQATDDFVYCLFRYDPNMHPREAASRLHTLVEADPYLTQARSRFIFDVHSLGGWVAHFYVAQFGTRKVLGRLYAGVPLLGTTHASRKRLEAALREIYPPVVSDAAIAGIKERVDFTTESLKWLDPDNREREQVLRMTPLDGSCFLYVGEVPPMSDSALARYITPLLLFDAWAWKADSLTGHLAYQFGARVIEVDGDVSGSDGVVSVDSASARGFSQQAVARHMGERDHSQIIQGSQADLALHQQMYSDMVSILPPKNKIDEEFGHFDLWLPEIPVLDIARRPDADLKSARLAWAYEGQIYTADGRGTSAYRLELGTGKFSWPRWIGDHLVVTRIQGSSTDLWLVSGDRRMVQLTADGKSELASPQNDGLLLAYISDGRLMLRSIGGLVRGVIGERLQLSTPPVIYEDKIYFATLGEGGEYDLYWVSLQAQGYALSQARRVGEATSAPMRVGDFLLACQQEDDRTIVTLVLGGMFGINHARLSLPLRWAISQPELGRVTRVDMDSVSQDVYFVADTVVRRIDQAAAGSYLGDWAKEITSMMSEKREGQFLIPTLDEVAPVVSPGIQLDVK